MQDSGSSRLMQLTDTEKEMLDGKAGEAVRIAMSIPVVTLNNEEFQLLKTLQHAVVDGTKGEIVLSGFGKKE